MRIAYVSETYPPEINGVSLTVARTVAHLRANGHEVEVVRPSQAGEQPGSALRCSGSEWLTSGYPIPVYPDLRFGISRTATLVERFAQLGTELVHVATEGPLGWSAVGAALQLGLPSTSDFRTNFHKYSNYYGVGWLEPLIGGYLRRFHNRTQRCFSPTRETRRALLASGFEHVEVVGRGVDLERFSPLRRDAQLRASWGVQNGPVLLYVGRLAAEKNVALALQSYRAARCRTPAARMVVVGDGPQRRKLEHQYPDVRFVGSKSGDALAAHYASADLFLFPSLSETFGNVTLEALASGLPVVAFDAAAAREHVIDGVNGRTVCPDDDAGFTQASCQLAARLDALQPMRVAARRATAALDWDTVLRRFEDQLVETCHGYRAQRSSAACLA